MEPISVTKKLDKKGLGFGKKVPRTLDIEGILDKVAETSLVEVCVRFLGSTYSGDSRALSF